MVVIAVLSFVISIAMYSVTNLIKNANEKTYATTKNEIEKAASNYLIENSNRLFFVPLDNSINNDKEYQCVTVQNLVDAGFLDNNVIKASVDKDKTVSMNDYIYVERNKETKSVVRRDYMANAYNSFVVSASSTSSDIIILSIASDFREVSPGVTEISTNHLTYSTSKYAQCVAGQYGCKNPQYSYLLVCAVVSKNGCANQTFCKYRRAESSTLYNGYGY